MIRMIWAIQMSVNDSNVLNNLIIKMIQMIWVTLK